MHRSHNDASDPNYGLFQTSAPFLAEVDKTNIVSVCIAAVGGSVAQREQMAQNVASLVQNVPLQWNNLIADYPNWNSRGSRPGTRRQIQVNTRIDSSCLSRLNNLSRSGNMPPSEIFIAAYLEDNLYPLLRKANRSHAFPSGRAIILLTDTTLQGNTEIANTLSHEYGHILGLADLYMEHPNGFMGGTLQGQPNSVMANQARPITDDEQAALRSMVDFLRTGRMECQANYQMVQYPEGSGVQEGSKGSTFCIRRDWTPGTQAQANPIGYIAGIDNSSGARGSTSASSSSTSSSRTGNTLRCSSRNGDEHCYRNLRKTSDNIPISIKFTGPAQILQKSADKYSEDNSHRDIFGGSNHETTFPRPRLNGSALRMQAKRNHQRRQQRQNRFSGQAHLRRYPQQL